MSGAVGEGDAGRAVPRLHEGRVELVEGAAGRVHLGVVLPRLRDHHQHRVRQRAAAEVQQLEHLVEGRRVASRPGCRSGRAGCRSPGITSLASWLSRARIQLRLPLTVLISPLCAISRYGCASGQDGKVLVENRECTRASSVAKRAVGQVGEERLELAGGQHALVDQGAGGQRREVDLAPRARPACAGRTPAGRGRGPRPGPPAAATNSWRKTGMQSRATWPTRSAADRHVAPAEDPQALLGGERLDRGSTAAAARPRRPAGRRCPTA